MMTESQLAEAAAFYGITMREAHRRYSVINNHGDDPRDPICVGCAKRPHEIGGYRVACMESEEDNPSDDDVRMYVIQEEGTYNRTNGHFLCDECYIKNGCPTSTSGWVCP